MRNPKRRLKIEQSPFFFVIENTKYFQDFVIFTVLNSLLWRNIQKKTP